MDILNILNSLVDEEKMDAKNPERPDNDGDNKQGRNWVMRRILTCV